MKSIPMKKRNMPLVMRLLLISTHMARETLFRVSLKYSQFASFSILVQEDFPIFELDQAELFLLRLDDTRRGVHSFRKQDFKLIHVQVPIYQSLIDSIIY
ncbi:hypothetical protein FGO68_gene8760 [Halteria grandinella]|uniref:Uncharacterized protein n=1 Tax=Halteria grandinella TaxID=5974 RepID=A0A8J8NCS8_HALGN|nr:hypothetical protein FGO68_gene8760 [Halteria grandinella]